MFLVLWAAVFRERKGRRDGIAALLFILANIGIGLLPYAVWVRYTAAAVIVAVYCIACKKEIRKAVFTALIFYNFHNLSYMIANSIYVKSVDFFLDNMGTLQENYQQQVYRCLSAGTLLFHFLYALIFATMVMAFYRIIKGCAIMDWRDVILLSVLNLVGSVFAGVVSGLLVVRTDAGIFSLFDEKPNLL